jgi:Tol biopolymer transport system component
MLKRSTLFIFCLVLIVSSKVYSQSLPIERIPVGDDARGPYGSGIPSISHDGNIIAFTYGDSAWIYNRETKGVFRIPGNINFPAPDNNYPRISANGRYVVFYSPQSLVEADDDNGRNDIYLYDLLTHQFSLITPGNDDHSSYYPAISADGQNISFTSTARNYLPVPIDRGFGTDIFVRNRNETGFQLVNGINGNIERNSNSTWSALSGDGRYIAFLSDDDNLLPSIPNYWYGVFVYDQKENKTTPITRVVGVLIPDNDQYGNSYKPSLSVDGRYIAYSDTHQVYVYDQLNGEIELISVNYEGEPANTAAYGPSISANGRYVAFSTPSNNIIPGLSGLEVDIFVRDRLTRQTALVTNVEGNRGSGVPSISGDGRIIAFSSGASNFVPNDPNGHVPDIFISPNPLWELPTEAPNLFHYTSLPITLTWSATTWATKYEIRVDETEDFTTSLAYEAITSALETTIINLPENGQYFWQVRGIDTNDNAGSWSSVQTFTLDEDE